MNHLTTDLIQALVTKQDITEVFRSHLESAINQLLQTELTAFLAYEKQCQQVKRMISGTDETVI